MNTSLDNVRLTRPREFSPSLRRLIALLSLSVTSALQAGNIVGQASDAAGLYLPGATVQLAGTNYTATTDREGRFSLSEVPAGEYTAVARSIGYNEASQSITVPSTGTVNTSFSLKNDILTLDKYVVEGIREGRARANQQKKSANNIMDIISADSIGNLPDRNAAEAVARLPGVNLAPMDGANDQPQGGEGRYVSIRGVDPNLNQVLIDGNTMSAPGGVRMGRAVPLDVLGASQISQIEVIKSTTPDLDGNSLGGTINVKTASAFDRKERLIQGSVLLTTTELGHNDSVSGNVSYSNRLGAHREWGLTLSAAYDDRDYFQQRPNFGEPVTYTTTDGSKVVLPEYVGPREVMGHRLNKGLTLNLEYRPDQNTEVFLRSTLNQSSTTQNWADFLIKTGGSSSIITPTSPTSGTFPVAKVNASYREVKQLRTQALYNVSTGMRKTFGQLTLEPNLSYSYAEEVKDMLQSLIFNIPAGKTGALEYEINPSDADAVPLKWDIVGNDWTDTARYQLATHRVDDGGFIEDSTYGAKFDATLKLNKVGSGFGYLKSGVKFTRRDRVSDAVSIRKDRVGSWTVADVPGAAGPKHSIFGGKYEQPFTVDWDKVITYLNGDPTRYTIDAVKSASNAVEDDYDITEDILAGYVMGNLTFGRLTLLGGLRWERTESTIGSWQERKDNGTYLGWFPVEYEAAAYDSYFPNLQMIYRPSDKWVIRGAITQTIGRPAYEDARPFGSFNYDLLGATPSFPYRGSLKIGNPDLKPYHATNYDLSAEMYLPSGGAFSAAFFRKDVDDPIYGFSEDRFEVIYEGIALENLSVSTQNNGKSGYIQGLELSIHQPFVFLPSPFNGFGVELNLTLVDSDVTILQRPGEKFPFFRQPDRIRNITLYYEKNRVSARLSYSYMGEMLTSVGSRTIKDKWADAQTRIDAQFRYRLSPHYALTAAVRNLTNEQEKYRYGHGGPLRESYITGRMYNAGVNFNF